MGNTSKRPQNSPRRWHPSVPYVVCAVFAILLILVWLFSRGPEPAPGPIVPPQAPSTPGR